MPRRSLGDKRFCANGNCRKMYTEAANANDRVSGLCPECSDHVAHGRGYKLDADLYRECQKASAAEPHYHNKGAERAKAEREVLRALDKVKPRLSPLAIEGMLDGGYTRQPQSSGANGWPSHLTGKKGGPRGSD